MLPNRKFEGDSSEGGTGYLAGKSRGNLPAILVEVKLAWNSVVREVLQNADVACEGAGKFREG